VSQAGRALAYAFESGALAAARAFFLRAEPSLENIDAEQSFRPEYLRLKQAGWPVSARIDRGAYDLGLVLLTKHKEENFANIARGWALLAMAQPGLLRRQRRWRGQPREACRQGVRPRGFAIEVSLPGLWLKRGERPPPDYWRDLARCARWATARG
jgi:16S rRNA (guanine1207-N2)-methyltransferase